MARLLCVLACAVCCAMVAQADAPRHGAADAPRQGAAQQWSLGGVATLGPVRHSLRSVAVDDPALAPATSSAWPAVKLETPGRSFASAEGGRSARWSLGGAINLTTWAAGIRDRLWLAAPQFYVGYKLSRDFRMRVAWGAVALFDSPVGAPGQLTFSPSNGFLGVDHRLLAGLTLSFGVVVPLSSPGYDSLSGQRTAGYSLAAGMAGLWDAFVWAPERAGMQVGLRLAPQRLATGLWGVVEADVAGTVAVQRYSQRVGDLYGQTALELLLGDTWLRFGARAQLVLITADSDGAQWAVAPVVRIQGEHLSLNARWNLNIDQPLGFMGAGLDISGLMVAVEGQL